MKPSYAVVSYALVALALFGVIVESLRSSIPPNDLNRLRYEQAEYLVQGSRSEVDWRILEPAAFAEARRTGRPILILIGAPWSNEARVADRELFSDREVVSFLNRYMMCIRIDAQADPRWMGAFLPFRRASLPVRSGFQIWFLTPEGQLFDNAGEVGTIRPIVAEVFTEILDRVKDRIAAIRAGTLGDYAPGSEQAADAALLNGASFPQAFLDARLLQEIAQNAAVGLGGIRRFGQVRISPNSLHYLLLTARSEELRKSLDAALQSQLADWLEGGFFESFDISSKRLAFDKVSVTNAEMMSVLAKAGEALSRPVYRRFAELTFDYLLRRAVQNGFVAGSEIGDEVRQERSKRKSFSPVRLRALLTLQERDIARREMGLLAESNPMMTVRLSDPSIAFDEARPVYSVLRKLRSAANTDRAFAGKRQLDIHGYVLARMIECARLWGDSERLRDADELFSRLDWFLAGDDVKHSLETGISDKPCLADYLAYADAALQHFLAFGRADSLEHGFQVLKRAKFLFESEVPGVWRIAISEGAGLGPQDVQVPEVLDFVRESCTAQAIRLCRDYGRLMGKIGAPVLQSAHSTAGQCSAMAGNLGTEGAGLFCSARGLSDDSYLVVLGSEAVVRAQQLVRQFPDRLVAPAIGPIRLVMPAKLPGIYIVSEGRNPAGPYTEQAAAEALKKNSKI